jgi:hypothetical protein
MWKRSYKDAATVVVYILYKMMKHNNNNIQMRSRRLFSYAFSPFSLITVWDHFLAFCWQVW